MEIVHSGNSCYMVEYEGIDLDFEYVNSLWGKVCSKKRVKDR